MGAYVGRTMLELFNPEVNEKPGKKLTAPVESESVERRKLTNVAYG